MSLEDVLPILCNNNLLECSDVFSCLRINRNCVKILSKSCYYLSSNKKGRIRTTALQQLQTISPSIQLIINEKSKFPNLTIGKLILLPQSSTKKQNVPRSQKIENYYRTILSILNNVLTWLKPVDIVLKFGQLTTYEIICTDEFLQPNSDYQKLLNPSQQLEDMSISTYFLNYCRVLSQKYANHTIQIQSLYQDFFLNSGWWSADRFLIS